MHVIHRRGWEIPEHQATPEGVFLNRRALLGAGASLAAATVVPGLTKAQRVTDIPDPTKDLYPFKRNEKYGIGDRPITPEEINGNYNNFYEFGTSKNVAKAAQNLRIRPWMVKIDGMVEKPFEISVDDLIGKMPLEERLYRHRCVEAWSMTIPWSGFPMSELVKLAQPTSSAKYVVMQTFQDNAAPGFRQTWYPWPYTEGLTIEEANNELTFLVTGMYGKPALKQMGAPLRLAVPWKYGFKSVKSIVRFEFTDKRPKTFWEGLQASEYGFWANVHPEVPHPRWSQATEEDIGTKTRRPTVIFNGYGEHVAHLYKGLEQERLWA
jgi:methionine sulfoxide reductase catalytic subunit